MNTAPVAQTDHVKLEKTNAAARLRRTWRSTGSRRAINWQTFSHITFTFKVTPRLLVRAIAWSIVLGLLGGLFRSIRAARLPVATALRET